jgi:hypothetical protein
MKLGRGNTDPLAPSVIRNDIVNALRGKGNGKLLTWEIHLLRKDNMDRLCRLLAVVDQEMRRFDDENVPLPRSIKDLFLKGYETQNSRGEEITIPIIAGDKWSDIKDTIYNTKDISWPGIKRQLRAWATDQDEIIQRMENKGHIQTVIKQAAKVSKSEERRAKEIEEAKKKKAEEGRQVSQVGKDKPKDIKKFCAICKGTDHFAITSDASGFSCTKYSADQINKDQNLKKLADDAMKKRKAKVATLKDGPGRQE